MRGSEPHVRVFVRGFPCLTTGVDPRSVDGHGANQTAKGNGHKAFAGSSPAVASPPSIHDGVAAEPVFRFRLVDAGRQTAGIFASHGAALFASTSRLMAHMKAASSRATAVMATVDRLPLAVRAR